MTGYFLDTSALLKRYIIEPGTSWITNIADPKNSHTIFIAQITPVEIASGIARLKREKSISPATAQAAELLINRHIRRQYENYLVEQSHHSAG